MSEKSHVPQKGIPKPRLKKYLGTLAAGSAMVLTATMVSNLYYNGIFPKAYADEVLGDVCVTATWTDSSKLAAQRGSCDSTPLPGGGGTGGTVGGDGTTGDTGGTVGDGTTGGNTGGTGNQPGDGTGGTVTTPVSYNGETIIGWASQDLATVSQDESDFGVKNGMLSTYVDFSGHKDFPEDFASAAKSRGASLLIAWEPYNMDSPILDQTEFRPASIAAGAYDTYITDWLRQAQTHTTDTSVLVRFAPEMNDAVRPWSIGVNGGNTRQDYINMWRHIYSIKAFTAPDVKMVWNPLVAGSDPSGNAVSLSSVYPGGDYVDILALDGFNWADVQKPGECNWQSYDDVFKAPIAEIKTLAAGKPWGIAETASVSKPDSFFRAGGACYDAWGSWVYDQPPGGYYQTTSDWITQAGWMKVMMQHAHDDGALFVNMFNTNKETDWRLNSTDAGKTVISDLSTAGSVTSGNTSSDLIKAALK